MSCPELYVEEFNSVDAGASMTYPVQIGSLKHNNYVVINDRPCKIIRYSTCKPGKHGSTKATIVGVDIFNHSKYEISGPTSNTIDAPLVVFKEYLLMGIDDQSYLTLTGNDNKTRQDIKFSEETEDDSELAERIKDEFFKGEIVYVSIMSSMGLEKITDFYKK